MNSSGLFLKNLRISNGYKTQTDFESTTLIAQGHISKIESSKMIPTLGTLLILARAFREVTYEEIIHQVSPSLVEDVNELMRIRVQQEIDDTFMNLLDEIYKRIFFDLENKQFLNKYCDSLSICIGPSCTSAIRTRVETFIDNMTKDVPKLDKNVKKVVYENFVKKESIRTFSLFERICERSIRASFSMTLQTTLKEQEEETTPVLRLEFSDVSAPVYLDSVMMSIKERRLVIELIRAHRKIEQSLTTEIDA
ncbi:helix-turn-helix domain-containing protein [Paenibacillus eucommiae]|uniref:Transcriptional regulator with XRE-family HTH domain n=1 Tax=Paenibacillus eucommiae TaxID=1355755 RepID=A0ABS4JCJ6_9BACL|nr:helix-turn-helix transcriptional regulator [Paenibacillus eucommiae]MBP1996925.1 transcriptional regulator with XRE-family HTH domain [Paenibacillus eucommiae]